MRKRLGMDLCLFFAFAFLVGGSNGQTKPGMDDWVGNQLNTVEEEYIQQTDPTWNSYVDAFGETEDTYPFTILFTDNPTLSYYGGLNGDEEIARWADMYEAANKLYNLFATLAGSYGTDGFKFKLPMRLHSHCPRGIPHLGIENLCEYFNLDGRVEERLPNYDLHIGYLEGPYPYVAGVGYCGIRGRYIHWPYNVGKDYLLWGHQGWLGSGFRDILEWSWNLANKDLQRIFIALWLEYYYGIPPDRGVYNHEWFPATVLAAEYRQGKRKEESGPRDLQLRMNVCTENNIFSDKWDNEYVSSHWDNWGQCQLRRFPFYDPYYELPMCRRSDPNQKGTQYSPRTSMITVYWIRGITVRKMTDCGEWSHQHQLPTPLSYFCPMLGNTEMMKTAEASLPGGNSGYVGVGGFWKWIETFFSSGVKWDVRSCRNCHLKEEGWNDFLKLTRMFYFWRFPNSSHVFSFKALFSPGIVMLKLTNVTALSRARSVYLLDNGRSPDVYPNDGHYTGMLTARPGKTLSVIVQSSGASAALYLASTLRPGSIQPFKGESERDSYDTGGNWHHRCQTPECVRGTKDGSFHHNNILGKLGKLFGKCFFMIKDELCLVMSNWRTTIGKFEYSRFCKKRGMRWTTIPDASDLEALERSYGQFKSLLSLGSWDSFVGKRYFWLNAMKHCCGGEVDRCAKRCNRTSSYMTRDNDLGVPTVFHWANETGLEWVIEDYKYPWMGKEPDNKPNKGYGAPFLMYHKSSHARWAYLIDTGLESTAYMLCEYDGWRDMLYPSYPKSYSAYGEGGIEDRRYSCTKEWREKLNLEEAKLYNHDEWNTFDDPKRVLRFGAETCNNILVRPQSVKVTVPRLPKAMTKPFPPQHLQVKIGGVGKTEGAKYYLLKFVIPQDNFINKYSHICCAPTIKEMFENVRTQSLCKCLGERDGKDMSTKMDGIGGMKFSLSNMTCNVSVCSVYMSNSVKSIGGGNWSQISNIVPVQEEKTCPEVVPPKAHNCFPKGYSEPLYEMETVTFQCKPDHISAEKDCVGISGNCSKNGTVVPGSMICEKAPGIDMKCKQECSCHEIKTIPGGMQEDALKCKETCTLNPDWMKLNDMKATIEGCGTIPTLTNSKKPPDVYLQGGDKLRGKYFRPKSTVELKCPEGLVVIGQADGTKSMKVECVKGKDPISIGWVPKSSLGKCDKGMLGKECKRSDECDQGAVCIKVGKKMICQCDKSAACVEDETKTSCVCGECKPPPPMKNIHWSDVENEGGKEERFLVGESKRATCFLPLMMTVKGRVIESTVYADIKCKRRWSTDGRVLTRPMTDPAYHHLECIQPVGVDENCLPGIGDVGECFQGLLCHEGKCVCQSKNETKVPENHLYCYDPTQDHLPCQEPGYDVGTVDIERKTAKVLQAKCKNDETSFTEGKFGKKMHWICRGGRWVPIDGTVHPVPIGLQCTKPKPGDRCNSTRNECTAGSYCSIFTGLCECLPGTKLTKKGKCQRWNKKCEEKPLKDAKITKAVPEEGVFYVDAKSFPKYGSYRYFDCAEGDVVVGTADRSLVFDCRGTKKVTAWWPDPSPFFSRVKPLECVKAPVKLGDACGDGYDNEEYEAHLTCHHAEAYSMCVYDMERAQQICDCPEEFSKKEEGRCVPFQCATPMANSYTMVNLTRQGAYGSYDIENTVGTEMTISCIDNSLVFEDTHIYVIKTTCRRPERNDEAEAKEFAGNWDNAENLLDKEGKARRCISRDYCDGIKYNCSVPNNEYCNLTTNTCQCIEGYYKHITKAGIRRCYKMFCNRVDSSTCEPPAIYNDEFLLPDENGKPGTGSEVYCTCPVGLMTADGRTNRQKFVCENNLRDRQSYWMARHERNKQYEYAVFQRCGEANPPVYVRTTEQIIDSARKKCIMRWYPNRRGQTLQSRAKRFRKIRFDQDEYGLLALGAFALGVLLNLMTFTLLHKAGKRIAVWHVQRGSSANTQPGTINNQQTREEQKL